MSQKNLRVLYNQINGQSQGPVLHVRHNGISRDVALEVLNVSATATDAAIKLALAQFLDAPLTQFDYMVIERHANGNLTMRPEAVFG